MAVDVVVVVGDAVVVPMVAVVMFCLWPAWRFVWHQCQTRQRPPGVLGGRGRE